MKCIRFLPLVFLTSVKSFAMFAPYVVLLLLVGYLISLMHSGSAPLPIKPGDLPQQSV